MNQSKALQLKVDELIVVLEKDAELIEKSLARLNELRVSLIRRNLDAMNQILLLVKEEAENRTSNDIIRDRIRGELSDILGCDVKSMKIGVLGNYLCEQQRDRLFEKRQVLLNLTKRMYTEHNLTNRLVSEYSKLNHRFLESIFYPKSQNKPSVYDASGKVDRDADSAFMNVKL